MKGRIHTFVGGAGGLTLLSTAGFSTLCGSDCTGEGGLSTWVSSFWGLGSCLTGDGDLTGLSTTGCGEETAAFVSIGATGLFADAGTVVWVTTGLNVFAIDTSAATPSVEYNCSRSKSGTLLSSPLNHSDEVRPGRPLGAGG